MTWVNTEGQHTWRRETWLVLGTDGITQRTLRGTTGQIPDRSTGPGRWQFGERSTVHTAALWSGTVHWRPHVKSATKQTCNEIWHFGGIILPASSQTRAAGRYLLSINLWQMDPGAAETGCEQNLCHVNGKMEKRMNGARLIVGSNQGGNLIGYHLVSPLLQWACLWWTRWSPDKQSSLPWAACRSVEAGGEEGHLSTRAESVLCGPQTNNDKAKCDFISLVLKQIIHTGVNDCRPRFNIYRSGGLFGAQNPCEVLSC